MGDRERKVKLRNIMKYLDVKSFDDFKDVFKRMVGEMLENCLEGKIGDKFGYTKYNYRNKNGENSCNGYSKKTLNSSLGEIEIKVSGERDGGQSRLLEKVYAAIDEQTALSELENFDEKLDNNIVRLQYTGMITGLIYRQISNIRKGSEHLFTPQML